MINALDSHSYGDIFKVSRFDRVIGELHKEQASQEDLTKLSNDDSGLRAASQEFEAIFVNMLLQQFRNSIPDDGLIPKSSELRTFEELMDKQMAVELGKSESFGIADMLFKQLKGIQDII